MLIDDEGELDDELGSAKSDRDVDSEGRIGVDSNINWSVEIEEGIASWTERL